MSKLNPINLRDLDWYRNFSVNGMDNSRLAVGFEIHWGGNLLSKMHSYGKGNYVDIVWIVVF